MEEQAPWERQEGESSRQFHAFAHYRDLGAARSLMKAWTLCRTACDHQPPPARQRLPRRWEIWSRSGDWVARAEAWDKHVDREQRDQFAKEQQDALSRHRRSFKALQNVALVPSRAILDALANPQSLARLRAKAEGSVEGFTSVMLLAQKLATLMPALVIGERLALGLAGQVVDVEVEERRDLSFANAVAADPRAVDLAIALLDQLARTAPGEAVPADLRADDRKVH